MRAFLTILKTLSRNRACARIRFEFEYEHEHENTRNEALRAGRGIELLGG